MTDIGEYAGKQVRCLMFYRGDRKLGALTFANCKPKKSTNNG